jgi:predicted RND superfamily exporter protein
MLNLQSQKVESVIWEKKLLESSDISSMYGEIMARSLEEVRQKTKVLESLPTVSKVQSVGDMFPKDQEAKIVILRKLSPFLKGVGTFPKTDTSVDPKELEEILGRIRFKMLDASSSQWGVNKPLETQMIEVRTLIDQLRQSIHSRDETRVRKDLDAFQMDLMQDLKDKLDILRANVNTRPMVLTDLPPNLVHRFVGRNGLYMIRVFPSEDIWEPTFLGRFVDDLKSSDPDATGDPVTLYIFTQAFRDGCIKAAFYAVAFIFIFLLLTFRSFRSTFLVLTPLFVGTLWTLGFMHLFDINLNLANSIFLPLIVGAGVEYGVIIMYRWRQREEGKTGVVLPFSTAMGVILAGLTTTVGFCSLCVSSHQGIFSLGLLTTIGSLCILAASIFFLPALLQCLFVSGEPSDPASPP